MVLPSWSEKCLKSANRVAKPSKPASAVFSAGLIINHWASDVKLLINLILLYFYYSVMLCGMARVLSVLKTDYTKIKINVINKGLCEIRDFPQIHK